MGLAKFASKSIQFLTDRISDILLYHFRQTAKPPRPPLVVLITISLLQRLKRQVAVLAVWRSWRSWRKIGDQCYSLLLKLIYECTRLYRTHVNNFQVYSCTQNSARNLIPSTQDELESLNYLTHFSILSHNSAAVLSQLNFSFCLKPNSISDCRRSLS